MVLELLLVGVGVRAVLDAVVGVGAVVGVVVGAVLGSVLPRLSLIGICTVRGRVLTLLKQVQLNSLVMVVSVRKTTTCS